MTSRSPIRASLAAALAALGLVFAPSPVGAAGAGDARVSEQPARGSVVPASAVAPLPLAPARPGPEAAQVARSVGPGSSPESLARGPAEAQAQDPHPTEQVEPPQVPAPRPERVTGEVTTPRFRILYTAQSEAPARALAERIESVRDAFVKVLGRDWPGVTEIRVGLGREEFDALALGGGRPPAWAVALAYPRHNVMLLEARSLSEPRGETTLRHELAHVALGRLGETWPRWFQEGLAMYLTGERFSVEHYSALFRAVTQERLLGFEHLTQAWPEHPGDVEIAYAQSLSFVEFLSSRYGPNQMGELIDSVKAGDTFEGAFARAFRSTLLLEERVWRDGLPARYSWLPIITGGSTLWVIAAAVCVAGWWRRKGQRAERALQMQAEEEAELAAERIAAAEAERAGYAADGGPLPGGDAAQPPQDDAQGGWQMDLWPDDDPNGPDDDKPKRTLH